MRPELVVAVVVAAAVSAGCTTGDYRSISLSADMGGGDAAHFQSLAAKGTNPVEDFDLGLPLWPAICASRETTIDRRPGGGAFVHVEDSRGVGLYLLGQSSIVSNFELEGRNLDWSSSSSLLLGLVSSSRGERSTDQGRTRQSGFGLLWGVLLNVSTTDGESSWRVLMIPFGG
jgi:hypothetical protein